MITAAGSKERLCSTTKVFELTLESCQCVQAAFHLDLNNFSCHLMQSWSAEVELHSATLVLEMGKSSVQTLGELRVYNFQQLSSKHHIFMLFVLWCSSRCSSGEWQVLTIPHFLTKKLQCCQIGAECFGLGTALACLLDLTLFTLNHVPTRFDELGQECSASCNFKPLHKLL